jgi:hypothetical protein
MVTSFGRMRSTETNSADAKAICEDWSIGIGTTRTAVSPAGIDGFGPILRDKLAGAAARAVLLRASPVGPHRADAKAGRLGRHDAPSRSFCDTCLGSVRPRYRPYELGSQHLTLPGSE